MSEVEQYEREAAETRERLRTSVDEIQRRLTPANIIQNAREQVRDTVRTSGNEAVTRVRDTVASNPLVLAAIGVAVALIVYRQTSKRRDRGDYADDDEYSAYSEGDTYVGGRDDRPGRLTRGWTQVRSGVTSAGERLGAAGDRVRSGLDGARGSIGYAASGLTSRAGDRLQSVRHGVSGAASGAGQAAQQALRSSADFARENPVVVVAVGLAAGAGLALLASDDQDAYSYSYQD